MILDLVVLFLSVSIQVLMLINASISLVLAIDTRLRKRYALLLTKIRLTKRNLLTGLLQEDVMKKVRQQDTFKVNQIILTTSTIWSLNCIQNYRKFRNDQSIECNLLMFLIIGL